MLQLGRHLGLIHCILCGRIGSAFRGCILGTHKLHHQGAVRLFCGALCVCQSATHLEGFEHGPLVYTRLCRLELGVGAMALGWRYIWRSACSYNRGDAIPVQA